MKSKSKMKFKLLNRKNGYSVKLSTSFTILKFNSKDFKLDIKFFKAKTDIRNLLELRITYKKSNPEIISEFLISFVANSIIADVNVYLLRKSSSEKIHIYQKLINREKYSIKTYRDIVYHIINVEYPSMYESYDFKK